ncbi:hypothetical protein DNTS_013475 [Danionella cerebrum]|uniref:Uncharacterized protein n=1 Tax=Danionella cerebrum TaxID=2873325 RepID=A0A553PWL9_9TELE|nr:hypothetical protein DNTS_013475 [Danionella translucida]
MFKLVLTLHQNQTRRFISTALNAIVSRSLANFLEKNTVDLYKMPLLHRRDPALLFVEGKKAPTFAGRPQGRRGVHLPPLLPEKSSSSSYPVRVEGHVFQSYPVYFADRGPLDRPGGTRPVVAVKNVSFSSCPGSPGQRFTDLSLSRLPGLSAGPTRLMENTSASMNKKIPFGGTDARRRVPKPTTFLPHISNLPLCRQ